MAFIENHEVTIWENNVTGNETTMQMFDIMFGLLCFCFLLFFGKTRKTWCQGLEFVGIKNRDTKLNFYMTLQATVKILDLGWEMADPNRREAERGGGGQRIQPNGEDQCRARQPLLLLVKSKFFPLLYKPKKLLKLAGPF